MKLVEKFVLVVVLTITQFAVAQSGSAPLSRHLGDSGGGPVNPSPQSTLVRILTPVSSQKLKDNFTTVRFELIDPSAYAGTPSFQLQMDGNDPLITSSTQQPFTGLTAGTHTITVQLVDANGSPLPGGRAAVEFFVPQTGTQPQQNPPAATSTSTPRKSLSFAGFKFLLPQPKVEDVDADLPPGSSPLPLISIIGFGILVGGIISAMKTRS